MMLDLESILRFKKDVVLVNKKILISIVNFKKLYMLVFNIDVERVLISC